MQKMHPHSPEQQWLTDYFNRLDIRYGYEPSFKIENGKLLKNRCLITFPKVNLGIHFKDTIILISNKLNAPDEVINKVLPLLPDIDIFHVGFEAGNNHQTIKLYLEYASRFQDQERAKNYKNLPTIVHIAFKWFPKSNMQYTTARYTRYPVEQVTDIQNRIAFIYKDNKESIPYQSTIQLLHHAAEQIDVSGMFYMEVEEDNERYSFDLNIYNAQLPVAQFEPFLYPILNYFHIPKSQYTPLMNSIKDKTMGHLSGGINRHGNEFISIYYGVEVFN